MALLDTHAPATQSPAQIIRSLFKVFQRSNRKTKAEAMVQKRPQHEANYMADIGMEVGF